MVRPRGQSRVQFGSDLPYAEIVLDERLTLRQLRLDEAAAFFAVIDDNREYLRRWLPWVDTTQTVAASEAFIATTLEQRGRGQTYGYAIVCDGDVVGHTSLMHLADEQSPEIGAWIASPMSGRGITTLAVEALTDLATLTLKLAGVVIRSRPENIGSNRVAEKAGYRLIGQVTDDARGKFNLWAVGQATTAQLAKRAPGDLPQ
jgi:ribosomal-protein-serine acetyltransferase